MSLRASWRSSRARPVAATALLGAACVAWAAAPLPTAGPAGTPLTIAAACCAALSTGQLITASVPPPGQYSYLGVVDRLWQWLLLMLRRRPWAEGMLLATLALEALHPARSWHTALLGAALLGYLFAIHLGESAAAGGTGSGVLKNQAPVLAAGLGLLVLAAASALLPSAGTGLAGNWLRTLAAVAAVLAAALALPL